MLLFVFCVILFSIVIFCVCVCSRGSDGQSSSSLLNKKPKPLAGKIAEIKAKEESSQCLYKKAPASSQESKLPNPANIRENGLKSKVTKPISNNNKKVETVLTPKSTSKKKASLILSKSQSANSSSSGKTIPTKNRFDNLTKLQSVHEKPLETNKPDMKKVDMFDVCFEFDIEEKSSNLFSDKTKPKNDESKSNIFSNDSKELLKTPQFKGECNYSKSPKSSPKLSDKCPLKEKKAPHTEECRLNKRPSLECSSLERKEGSKNSPPSALKIPASGDKLSPKEGLGLSRLGSPSVSGRTSSAKVK